MRVGRLFWKLFIGNLALMGAVVVICAWLAIAQVDSFYAQELTTHLRTQAEALREAVQDRFSTAGADELDRLAKRIGTGEESGLRITFISSDGTVLGDSEGNPAIMEDHRARPEVAGALRAGIGEDVRTSRTVARPMKYLAVRVGPPEAPVGVVRVAMAIRNIGRRTGQLHALLWGIPAIGLVAAAVLALGLARLWSSPIQRITATARSLSQGDLSARVRVRGHDELASLARALNVMRDHLAAQLDTIDHQRRTLQSLLAQLHEGVIVADGDGRLVLVNPAAVRLLDIASLDPIALQGRSVEECVRDHTLQKMLLGAGRPTSDGGPDGSVDETRLQVKAGVAEAWLLARASDILLPAPAGRDADGDGRPTAAGRLLVLTDITALNHLMQVKADFAANASHELRTPLSAIRAAVETLLHMDLAREAEPAAHFLQVIERQNGRMEAMVADLLNLSRIESTPGRFTPGAIPLDAFMGELHARFAERLRSKNLAWQLDVPRELKSVHANLHLLRLVMDNLVDNAIKFTEAGGRVAITCCVDAGLPGVAISVADTGCGIPDEEQSRVFERFYQVERARSGGARGTGLGLSIVRHAMSAMRGSVELHSKPGEGTTVTILIPAPPASPIDSSDAHNAGT